MNKSRHKKTILFFVIAIVFIVVGVAFGQNEEVFSKATKICLECIGIG